MKRTFLATGALLALAAALASSDLAPSSGLRVFMDLVVVDAKRKPVLKLTANEVNIRQEGVQQTVATFVAKDTPGHYEISYEPISGKAGAVTVRLLRAGTTVTGPGGGPLHPRVVAPLSPTEKELTQILEGRPDANDFLSAASWFRFNSVPKGHHYTLAVELMLGDLVPADHKGPWSGHLQMLARLKDAEGRIVHSFPLERELSTGVESGLSAQRFVWTAEVHLSTGRYTLESAVREAANAARASVRRTDFTVVELPAGLRMSSVALLQPVGVRVVRDGAQTSDDAFMLAGAPVMPILDLKIAAARGAKVDFFTIVYPNRASGEPALMRLSVLRDDKVVGATALTLNPPDAQGEIRYSGSMPIHTFPAGDYVLRLDVKQGEALVFGDAKFAVAARLDR